MTPQGVFGGVAEVDDYVKSQTTFTQFYDGFGFYGTLGSIDTDGMFKVKFASKKTAIVEGAPVAVPKIITLVGGWNYLPCPYQSPVELSIAMPKMTYAEDDMVKSQITFSTFYGEYGWYGTLKDLAPGQGYKLKTAIGGSATFDGK